MTLHRTRSLHLLLVVCFSAIGCSGAPDDAPDLAAVRGTVTLDGIPVVGAYVQFIPNSLSGTSGPPSSGATDSSGNYTLTGIEEPERGVALHVTYASGTGVHSTELRLRSGIISELSDEMTELLSSTGPLETLEENYNDIIDNIEDRIEAEEKRLLLYEEMLTQRFARLDTFISRMTQLSGSIASMMTQQQT